MKLTPSTRLMRIAFVGAGNVATHLALAMHAAGWSVVAVYSRTQTSAVALASRLGCVATDCLSALPEADVYVFSVVDNVLPTLLTTFTQQGRQGLWVHTAGSIPLSVFKGLHTEAGVLYPMQTFSKTKEVDFSQVPLFIEATTSQSLEKIQQIAHSLSPHVQVLDSQARGRMHVAAVFACNFVNHCYAHAARLMEQSGLPFSLLWPLIDETAHKVHQLKPADAQTGPAVRHDDAVMERHLELLNDHPRQAELYQLMSNSIMEWGTYQSEEVQNQKRKVE